MKRGDARAHLKKLRTDVAFLQETHLRNPDHHRLRCKWTGHIFHSPFHFKSRGTAVIIKNSTPFTASEVISDLQGRFVIVTGNLHDYQITLANIYAPKVHDWSIYINCLAKLRNMNSHRLVIGGDFNLVLDPNLDRSWNKPLALSKSAGRIHTFLDTYKWSDPWRTLFPNARQDSYFSVHHTYSRIDLFLIDEGLLPLMKNCEYKLTVISDHGPLTLQLTFGQDTLQRYGVWIIAYYQIKKWLRNWEMK